MNMATTTNGCMGTSATAELTILDTTRMIRRFLVANDALVIAALPQDDPPVHVSR
jgi:hypothetical protein